MQQQRLLTSSVLKQIAIDTHCLKQYEIMNKIFRKRLHMNVVEHHVCKLRQEIFKSALDGKLSPIKVELFKKYNRYLKLLKF